MSDRIGVIGSGTMGAGIAQVAAAAGYAVTLIDTEIDRSQAAIGRIAAALEKLVAREKMAAAERDGILGNLVAHTDVGQLRGATLIIEAVFEDLATKRSVIEGVCADAGSDIPFATNTSSLSITRLASFHARPSNVAGMHFFNPVPVFPLVELIRADQTAPETLAVIRAAAERMGKTAVEVADTPGFAVNRILIPMINEAVICLETGVADRDAIDATMKLGASHPLGPLALADLIGIDVVLSIMQVLHRELGEDKYRPALSLARMVAAGRLGRKSGGGFYDYP